MNLENLTTLDVPELIVRLRHLEPSSLEGYARGLVERLEAANHDVLAFIPEHEPPRAERVATEVRQLLERFPEPGARPALFGVPVGVKDIIDVAGLATRAGTAVPLPPIAPIDATIVARLRAAGAFVLGKTVTTEFAYFEPGPTRNPRARAHTPGGSSSGSAAGVAAGLVPAALGSQTVGSVIRPAAYCGVVGFKPSYGRVPLEGVLAYSPAVDTAGWFTSSVEGARTLAAVLLDRWDTRPPHDTTTLVLGVPDGPYLEQATEAARDAFERILAHLERQGVVVRRLATLVDIEAVSERHRWITSAEFAEVHAKRFDDWGPLFRPRTAQLVEDGRAVTPSQRAEGYAGREQLRGSLDAQLAANEIDVWVSPAATGPAPLGLSSTGDPAMNLPWTHAGVPVVNLPAGNLEGLPLGLQLAGAYGADEALLATAIRVERMLGTASAR